MFEVIIPTYNRTEKAFKLAEEIIKISSEKINRVIIVDSTINHGNAIISHNKIYYLFSSHQNQPYQRFLGFKASTAELLIFFDDDMEIIDKGIFNKTQEVFKNNNLIAVSYNFNERHHDTSLSKIPGTVLPGNHSVIRTIINFPTGYPNPGKGEYGLCGTRGSQPDGNRYTELLSGGAFAVRRNAIYKDFNFQLFDLYEKKLGKGEDGILGYTLSKQGKVIYLSQLCLLHNDQQNSTYSIDLLAFSKRVAFSRLYLSLEKCRLDKRKYFWAWLHYHYYMLWRFVGLCLNYLMDTNEVRLGILKGTFKGWSLATKFKFSRHNESFIYWNAEATKDMSATRTDLVD